MTLAPTYAPDPTGAASGAVSHDSDDSTDDDSEDDGDTKTGEMERLRVLAAAGLVVQNHGSNGKRRPPPPRPRSTSFNSIDRLQPRAAVPPGTPSPVQLEEVRPPDDAYAIWQTLKLTRSGAADAGNGVHAGVIPDTIGDEHSTAFTEICTKVSPETGQVSTQTPHALPAFVD